MQWKELYDKAAEKLAPRAVSPFIEAGGVAAAILTAAGNVYTGVCIDTACTLGMCAERSAIANMITNGESRIVRLVCVMGDGRVGMPCGACREFMMQLDKMCIRDRNLDNAYAQQILALQQAAAQAAQKRW